MTPPLLARYRERHTITADLVRDQDTGRNVYRCRHDDIRVVPKSPFPGGEASWVHDTVEIKYWAAVERGEVA